MINEINEGAEQTLHGLAANDTYLFVGNAVTGRINVYDAQTMASVRSWDCRGVKRLAVDKEGYLWVLQYAAGAWKIIKYRDTGIELSH